MNCGEEAWSVIVRVLRDTTRTLMPTCRLTPDVIPPGRIPFATTTFSNNLVRDDVNPRTQRPPNIFDWNTKDPYEGNRVQIADYNRVYPTQNSNGYNPGSYYDNGNSFGQAARDSGGSRSRTRNGAEKSRICLKSGGIFFFSILTFFFVHLLSFWD